MIKTKTTGATTKEIQDHFKKITEFRPMLKEIGEDLEASTKRRFNTGENPQGNSWKTSQRVLSQGKGRTLVETGNLQKSISYSYDDNEVNIGTNVDYAQQHQEGLDGLPKRSFLGISNKDRRNIEDIIKDHIENA